MELVIKSDWLYVMDNVLTSEECKELIEIAEPTLEDSTTVGTVIKGYRTSSNTYISKEIDNKVIQATNLITQVLTELPTENQEDMCIVKYREGEEYKKHRDYMVDNQTEEGKAEMARGGDRAFTVMFYLNDDFEEGGTLFVTPNIEVKPKTGRCVIWKNYIDGKPNTKSMHAGLPIKKGIKYIGVKWVRQNKFI
jgi:prolyl 4-hydroxylase|tara:strand:- start:2654 stop:3235 length:582 start_codon:yes stop_codon:yes gene_type:complete